jgi:hypothetical protein
VVEEYDKYTLIGNTKIEIKTPEDFEKIIVESLK